MKQILRYFPVFHKGYFSIKVYMAFLLFVALLFVFNYSYDFEDSFIDSYRGSPVRAIFFFLYNALAYYGALLVIFWTSGRKLPRSREFWIKSLLVLCILSFDRTLYIYKTLLAEYGPSEIYAFVSRIMANSAGFLTVVLPAFVLLRIFDRKQNFGLYGLTVRNVNFKPYWVLLILMVPVLYFGSMNADLSSFYPTYQRAKGDLFAAYFTIPEWQAMLIYEVVYLFDFLFTELFFRGVLVIGFIKLLGKDSVLPMVATYAMLHFGKPLPEAMSSVFGGYILGIIAYYSKNIWGGVFLHGGIALLMELFTL